ncbi:MAG: hypothetical protein JXB35_06660 [Anaerolineae bacterium]|nr:hypothetical protein [Anaerolineae bacterium]
MPDFPLFPQIAPLIAAQRKQSALAGAGWGLLVALATALGGATAARLQPLWRRETLLLAAGAGLLAGALLGAGIGYGWPRPWPQRLNDLDRRLKFAARLTTAWQLHTGVISAPPLLTRQQQRETQTALEQCDARSAYPLRLPRRLLAAIGGAGFGLLLMLLLPNPQEAVLAQHAAVRAAAQAEAVHIETLLEAVEAAPDLAPEDREALAEILAATLASLQDSGAPPERLEEALLEAEGRLASLQAPEEAARLPALRDAAATLDDETADPLAGALQAGEIQDAAAALRELAGSPTLDPTTQENLARTFESLSAALESAAPDLAAAFDEIAEDLQSGSPETQAAALEQAAARLEQAQQASTRQAHIEEAHTALRAAENQLRRAAPSPEAPSWAWESPAARDDENAMPGSGASGRHEDAGAADPVGETVAPRLAASSEEISLPREETLGTPHPTIGTPGESRVPYQDIYAEYAQAAEATLANRRYPPALERYIQVYFTALGDQGP